MTPHPSPEAADPAARLSLRALISKWRHAAEHLGLDGLASLADCADELEAALTSPASAEGDSYHEPMFKAAVLQLAQISEALGIDPEEAACANGNQLILEAIERKKEALHEAVRRPRVLEAPSVVADILKDCCECERPNHWDVETVELRVSDLTMILQRHIEGKE